MSTTITRVGFCPHCARERRPITGQYFLAYGTTGGYKVEIAVRIGDHGFVPHLYMLGKVVGENVIAFKACSMCDCVAVAERWIEKRLQYYIPTTAWQRTIFTLEQWNALVLLKDTGYEI